MSLWSRWLVRRWRRRLRRTEPVRYRSLFRDDRSLSLTEQAAEIIESGWTLGRHDPVMLDPPLPWDALAEESRSWSYHLHSWRPLMPLLGAYSERPDRSLLERCLLVVDDWLGSFADGAPRGSFAWYDMAVGTRADVLAALTEFVARDRHFDDATVERLIETARAHDRFLVDPDLFAAHNNHGMYQAAGQLALAHRLEGLPGFSHRSLGERRLGDLFEAHFSAEGVHLEHSPGYHAATLQILDAILGTGLVTAPRLFEAKERIERALAWFVLPNGYAAMFGDTDHRDMTDPPRTPSTATTGELAFVRSGGETGLRPRATVRGFDDGGYFVARSGWPAPPDDPAAASYLGQIAGFHSRTHKHADDLSVIWYDRSREILVDAGRFGYLGRTEPGSEAARRGFWYSDPRRMYVESTRAHNTIQIDDLDHARRGRRPYGSALGRWGESDGIAFSEAHVRHGHIRHARLLFFEPGQWLAVVDWLWDNDDDPHRFRQWWHIAPDLDVVAVSGGLNVESDGWDRLVVLPLLEGSVPIEPVRGQEEPELQGWWSERSGRFEPNWAFGFEATGSSRHTFATLFAFGDDVVAGGSTVATSGRAGTLTWEADGRPVSIRFERPEAGEFVVTRR